jgi:ATPase family associated with various cellular activities (AAA)
MKVAESSEWQDLNIAYLMAEIHNALLRVQNQDAQHLSKDIEAFSNFKSSLDHLCSTFSLSSFERDILLLCAGAEFIPNFGEVLGQNQLLVNGLPTLRCIFSVLKHPQWKALAAQAPLRRWQLIEVGGGSMLMTAPLRVTESILQYLLGNVQLDQRLSRRVYLIEQSSFPVLSHQTIAQEMISPWKDSSDWWSFPLIQLFKGEYSSQIAIAASICQNFDFKLYRLSSHAIPTQLAELEQFIRLWERESALHQWVLLLDWQESREPNAERENAIARFIEWIKSPLMILSQERRAIANRTCLAFEISDLTLPDQILLWQNELGDAAQYLSDYQIPMLAAQFNLNAVAIHSIATQTLSECTLSDSSLATRLWHRCRTQSRPQLDHLATRIETFATWEDLILPAPDLNQLQEIVAHVRHRATVYELWGFAEKSRRGLGITALFQGRSGTGKTTAAEIIARELQLDLYRIDLSQVVSKYIGETEKNLGAIFDAAELGGVVLLFDEADALFGKRSEVKDAHDRYANMEVSYLLQRMEAYQGLAILTTNLKETIDTAFLRRIRFVIKFPFPDVPQRKELWERIFPARTPTQDLDASKLARLNVAGGNIRNIALNAAFLAAEAAEPVQMKHVLAASKSEYAKLERSLTDAEIRGWVSASVGKH